MCHASGVLSAKQSSNIGSGEDMFEAYERADRWRLPGAGKTGTKSDQVLDDSKQAFPSDTVRQGSCTLRFGEAQHHRSGNSCWSTLCETHTDIVDDSAQQWRIGVVRSCGGSGIRTWTSEFVFQHWDISAKLEVFSDGSAAEGSAGRIGHATSTRWVSLGAGTNQRRTHVYLTRAVSPWRAPEKQKSRRGTAASVLPVPGSPVMLLCERGVW